MKYSYFILVLILFVYLLTSCSEKTEVSNQSNFPEHTGVFDLKVACLNLLPPSKTKEDICEIPLSKNSKPNAESVWVVLKLCNSQRKTSCIEPLPHNAPPEVIQIRDENSEIMQPWAKVKVTFQTQNETDKRTKPLVLQIKNL
jgi:hypothetical protein